MESLEERIVFNGGIWISTTELMQLPTTGTAWESLEDAAATSTSNPDISNQDDNTDAHTLAKALVGVRTGNQQYLSEVRSTVMAAMGTEDGGRTLALGRNLAPYVIAADLVGLNATQDAEFRAWLTETRTEELSGRTLVSTHEDRPNNWGTMAGASRAAIAAYLGDQADLQQTAQVFRGWMGDRAAYADFSYGSDLSWQADPDNPVGINPVGATKDGHSIAGAQPEEMRRGGSFQWPPAETGYPWEALQGAVVQAEILFRAGHDTWQAEDQAIRRAADFLHDLGWEAEGDDEWTPWILNARYGTNYPAQEGARHGKIMGWTDWTHAAPLPPPLPSLAIDDVQVDESQSAAFTVTLSDPSSTDVEFDYTTSDGTATADDYTPTSGRGTIPAGDLTATITVPINDDSLDELNETFQVTLSNPAGTTISDDTALATIVDNDEVPEVLLSNDSVSEGADTTSPLQIGNLVTDTGGGEPTYSLVPGAGADDNGLFEISEDQLLLAAGATLDHETQDALSIRIRTTDGSDLSFDSNFTVHVLDVNETPTAIALDNNTIDENTDTTAAVPVGTLSAADPDAGDAHSFALVAGTGAEQNELFQINGNRLELKPGVELDHETEPSYTARVRATDAGGLFVDRDVTVMVRNLIEVEGVQIDDATAQRSTLRSLTVTFDRPVTVEPGAFELRRLGTAGSVELQMAVDNSGSKTVVLLEFSGSLTESGSLKDGNYVLEIDATKVHDGNDLLDGDQNGISGGNYLFGAEETDNFFRLYGDADGNGIVGADDFSLLASAFGKSRDHPDYRSYLDWDDDGIVDIADFLDRFVPNFGTSRETDVFSSPI